MIDLCYHCFRPLQEVAPLEDPREVRKGICDDCLKLESPEVQQALKWLTEAGTVARLRGEEKISG
jgi:hypothetical protein